jgi:hypothetical protein
VVDFWRAVAIGVVVIGHWLAAAIWLQPDDEIGLLNALEWIPYAGWVTWVFQVMPVFFLAGGYANARGLRKVIAGEQLRRDWITGRVRRLFTPVIPLLVVWTLLSVILRTFVSADIVYAGAMSATIPLWFLAIYLGLTGAAPLTHKWWRSHGVGSVVILAAAAVGVDAVRFTFDLPGIGWINFVLVWATLHQVGYLWSARDTAGGVPPRTGWLTAGGALAALIAVTWIGWYPVAMVGVPGADVTNFMPPTSAMTLLGVVQIGVIWGTHRAVLRFVHRVRVWHAVVGFSGVIMTVYLWHLSAMSLVATIGLLTFDGEAFRIEPGTSTWWATRPVWIAILLLVTALLVAVFAPFEWRISDAATPRKRRIVTIGVLLTAGSAAAVAVWGIATPDAVINWGIPASAIAGAAMVGALPSLWKGGREPPG